MGNRHNMINTIRKLLKDKKVKYVIGYQESTNGLIAKPMFLKDLNDVDKLIWNPSCVNNLVLYLKDEKVKRDRDKKENELPVAIIVKGCDSKALNVLLQEKFIERDLIYIIGISCENTGVIDERKVKEKFKDKKIKNIDFGEIDQYVINSQSEKIKVPVREIIADRCLECEYPYPQIYDVFIGDKIKREIKKPFKVLEKIEALNKQEKWEFWQEKLSSCIRCYACRSICPMCYCNECVVDSIEYAVSMDTTAEEKAKKIKWIEKSAVFSENYFFHLIRTLHLAGRCINCRECQRVCPVDIPIHLLNKKMEKEAKMVFDYDSGLDISQPSLVSIFKEDDPEDFIL